MILRDPVHGLVAFEGPEERIIEDLLATPEVQRLRRIRQLGVTSMAFPGAEHSRFAHALGAAFVMKLLLQRLRALQDSLPESQRITLDRGREALAAAFLHDLGHGPFSHVSEISLELFADRSKVPADQVQGKIHELITAHLILTDPAIVRELGQAACQQVGKFTVHSFDNRGP